MGLRFTYTENAPCFLLSIWQTLTEGAAKQVFRYLCSRFETRAKPLGTLAQINTHFSCLQASFI